MSRPRLPCDIPEHIPVCHNLHEGQLNIPNVCSNLSFQAEDLRDEGEIGRGAYGFVNKMTHVDSGTCMAVKRIRVVLDSQEMDNATRDLDIVMKATVCSNIVRFYGALFHEGDCWICMELLDTSLDIFYRYVYHIKKSFIPEDILGKIAVDVVKSLDYLKTALNVIHRDVKPSNILIDRKGNVKLCDFGISARLVDSIAKSRDAGCRPYMAPERINPKVASYDTRSDVWSFGITLIELATGRFPFPEWKTVFDQLQSVLKEEAPQLPKESHGRTLSEDFRQFVSECLHKEVEQRPKYDEMNDIHWRCSSSKIPFFRFIPLQNSIRQF